MPGPTRDPVPIKKVYPIRDLETVESPEPVTGGWTQGLPIAIDLGTYRTRVGYASNYEDGPQHEFPTHSAKYRDRKINHSFQLVGNDVYLDTTAKQNIKNPFDGGLIQNWDMIETIMDYSFSKISVQSQGRIDNPVVMTELLACPTTQRRTMNELMFETYQVSSLVYGVDSLFSFYYSGGQNGLVISAGNESSHIIPVVNGKGLMPMAKRIDWGGRQAAEYLQGLLTLKYPMFPTKLSFAQASHLMHDHCYVSSEYEPEVSRFLEWKGLEDRERVVEAPYTPTVVVEKSEEELARIAEKRKESGRRLQEQAAKARLEKLMEKERNYEYYKELQQQVMNGPKRDIKKVLDREGFKNEDQLQKTIDDLDKSIRRARKLDVGDTDDQQEAPSFPLVDIPDDQLTEEDIKQKRKQKLLKANYESRLRAKEEKELEKKRQEEEAQKDAEWRAKDFDGWVQHHRDQLSEIFSKRHEKQQLKEDLSNRKSHASQMRMKNIAALANENSRGKRRRGGQMKDDDPDDTFGADDNDWSIYRNIANATDSEEEEEEERRLKDLQKRLETHDPEFRLEDFSRQKGALDWRDSVVNMFLRGPREFDAENQAQAHQMNINIERIRVPEVLFEPDMVGLDSAGIPELVENTLVKHWPGPLSDEVTQNIFLTGGFSQFENFDTRIHNEVRAVLPIGKPLRVVRAADAARDAWRGMAKWATTSPDFKSSSVSRQEYQEMGVEYIKEHGLGNLFV